MEARPIADRQESRQRAEQDDGIANDHIRLRMADLVLRPGVDSDARGSIEGRNIEGDFRRSVRADFHHAGITHQRRVARRRILARLRRGVAAGADITARSLHAVDQQAVDVADLHRQLPLAEEMLERIGRLVARQIEDAEIDGRDRDISLLARLQAGEPDRNIERSARLDDRLGSRLDRQLATLPVHGEPGEAERAARHAPGGLIERTMRHRDHIGAGAPLRLRVEIDRRSIRRDIDDAPLIHLVADDADRRLAGESGTQGELHPVA